MEVSILRWTYVEYFLVLELCYSSLGISIWLEISEFGQFVDLVLKFFLEARVDDENDQDGAVVTAIYSLDFLYKHLQGSFVCWQLQFIESSIIAQTLDCGNECKFVALQHISDSLLRMFLILNIFGHDSLKSMQFLLLLGVIHTTDIINPFYYIYWHILNQSQLNYLIFTWSSYWKSMS